nr:MAG TPA: hypothetical protein [Caudoviricetes sp.]
MDDNNYEVIFITNDNDEWHYTWDKRADALYDKFIFGGTLYLKELSTGRIEEI